MKKSAIKRVKNRSALHKKNFWEMSVSRPVRQSGIQYMLKGTFCTMQKNSETISPI
jgi:hypothetical protein